MAKFTYVGFSTSEPRSGKREWKAYDTTLIKRDLTNHFYTRLGECVMRPEHGCRIWDYIMEPNVDSVRNKILAEAERVLGMDSRVVTDNIRMVAFDHGVTITADLLYRHNRTVDQFIITFDSRQGNY